MRKLILQEWISLDGFVADRNGNLDFFTTLNPEMNRYSDLDQLKFLDGIDAIILGRNTYQLFVDFWPTATTDTEVIADRLNSTKKYIFSNTLSSTPWGNWPEAEVVKGDAADQIQKLKQQQGKDMVLWGSISLAQSLMKRDLIDEYHLQLCPTATGGGKPLFPDNDAYMNMSLIGVNKYDTGVVFLRYMPKSR